MGTAGRGFFRGEGVGGQDGDHDVDAGGACGAPSFYQFGPSTM
jgi:hypothetical protein